MTEAVLFTQPDPRTRPTATDLLRIDKMTEVVLTVDGMEWRYPTGTVRPKRGGEIAILLLRYDAVPLNLASVPDAVAVAVIDGDHGWLCWFGGGELLLAEYCHTMAFARSEVEGQCCQAGNTDLDLLRG